MIELFLNHWMSSSHSISHWINYVRILTCSSLMLQLLKTTCCLNSSLATLAWIPSNLWHHTHSIIKSLVVLCLLACLLFFLKGVLCWKMHTKVVQMLFVSEQGFQSSYLWLQMFILMGYCAILAVWTSVALYVCSQWCQHIVFRYIILSPIALLLVTGGSEKCNTCRSRDGIFAKVRAAAGCEAEAAGPLGGGWERGTFPRAETKSSAWSTQYALGVYFTIAVATTRGMGLSYVAGNLVESQPVFPWYRSQLFTS